MNLRVRARVRTVDSVFPDVVRYILISSRLWPTVKAPYPNWTQLTCSFFLSPLRCKLMNVTLQSNITLTMTIKKC